MSFSHWLKLPATVFFTKAHACSYLLNLALWYAKNLMSEIPKLVLALRKPWQMSYLPGVYLIVIIFGVFGLCEEQPPKTNKQVLRSTTVYSGVNQVIDGERWKYHTIRLPRKENDKIHVFSISFASKVTFFTCEWSSALKHMFKLKRMQFYTEFFCLTGPMLVVCVAPLENIEVTLSMHTSATPNHKLLPIAKKDLFELIWLIDEH